MINRQAAIDAINTWDKFGVDERGRIVRWYEGLEPYVHLRDVVTAIVNLPSAQPERCEDCETFSKTRLLIPQPEIIRCKNCKYQEKYFHEDRRRKDGGYYTYGCELAEGYSRVCLDDDFCSRAERRTDD